MKLNVVGTKLPIQVKEKTATEIDIPKEFTDALKKNKKALEIFESKSPSFRKNYFRWIASAKTDETIQKRIGQSLEWIKEGKDRFGNQENSSPVIKYSKEKISF